MQADLAVADLVLETMESLTCITWHEQASGVRIKISDRGDFVVGTKDRCVSFVCFRTIAGRKCVKNCILQA